MNSPAETATNYVHDLIVAHPFCKGAGATTIQTIEAGEALGWSWLFSPHQWQFTARAIEPVEAAAFGAASLRENAEENHDFGYELLTRVGHVMLQRLQATRRRLIEFYVHDIVE